MTSPNNYADIVRQAAEAVSSVKDAELRKVAFERILDALLSPAQAGPQATTNRPAKTRRAAERSRREASGPGAYIEELIEEDFFKSPKSLSQVKQELANHGHHIAVTSLSGPLQKKCQKKRLRRQLAKSEGKRRKQTYVYSNH